MAGKAAPSGWVYAAVAVSLFVAGYGVGGRVGRPGGPNIYTPRAQHARVLVPPEFFNSIELPENSLVASVYSLPGLLKDPPAGPRHATFAGLYDVLIEKTDMAIPSGMLAKLQAAGKDPNSFRSQSIVSIFDLVRPGESIAHNKLRAQRFGNAAAGSDRQAIEEHFDALKCKQPDFCDVVNLVGAETWGRLEDKGAVTGSNMAKLGMNHGLVIAKNTFQPMRLTESDFVAMFEVTMAWFDRSYAANKAAKFPVMCCDTMFKGGASQLHPHFQVFLRQKHYSSKWEGISNAAYTYRRPDGSGSAGAYYMDTVATHVWLGLAIGRVASFVSYVPLTAASGGEIIIMGQGSGADIGRIFHKTLEAAYTALGWTAVSTSCAFPSMDPGSEGIPVTMCRLLQRQKYSSEVNDISANELLATTSVSSDAFELARQLRTHFKGER